MPLRSGKQYLKLLLPDDERPFKLILLPKKTYNVPQEVKIDFDEASRQWRKNKVHLGEGMFIYKRYSERLFS